MFFLDTDAIIDPHNQKEQLITGDRYEYQQNHKPMFKDCDTYRPEVEEEQQRGAHVITVIIIDLMFHENVSKRTRFHILRSMRTISIPKRERAAKLHTT